MLEREIGDVFEVGVKLGGEVGDGRVRERVGDFEDGEVEGGGGGEPEEGGCCWEG